MKLLNRQELFEKLNEIEYWPELIADLNFYLVTFMGAEDFEMVSLLLKSGANPNPKEEHDCYIYNFLNIYTNSPNLKGEMALKFTEELLKYGANPNRIWQGGFRAYDLAAQWNHKPFMALLEKYGADQNLLKGI